MIARLIIAIVRPFVFIFFPYKIVGAENLHGSGRLMLCSNHLSNFDPVFLLIGQPRRICFMAKEELFRFKPLGFLLSKLYGAFPVARGKGDTSALEKAEKAILSGEVMGIFPEGTRSKSGKLMRFKSGAVLIAAHTGASVIPCGIDRRAKLFRRVTVTVGAPISPEELHTVGEKPDLRYATRLVRERVRELSGQEVE